MRQNIDERDEQDDLAPHGEEERRLRVAERHKRLLAGDLDAENTAAPHVDAHGPRRVFDQRGVIIENQDERAREELDQKPDGH